MENTAHQGETKEHRLARFQNGSPVESIETLLNSISNFFNNEIKLAPDNAQTTLLFLGIHAVALTIAKAFFGLDGPEGYKKFLEYFVDGDTDDLKFSLVAEQIHNWRNTIAHRWLSSVGHEIEYNYAIAEGWVADGDVTVINPKIYCRQYLAAFGGGGKIWGYNKIFTADELEAIKQRIITRYG